MIERTLQQYDPKRIVAVVGYPKSGNTLMSGLLGAALDCPVVGYKNAAPIATEGLDRNGYYRVSQLHLRPVEDECPEAIVDGWKFAHKAYRGERIVHIVRDPRDVAVSLKYYFDQESIATVLTQMRDGVFPVAGVGAWDKFIEGWLDIEPLLSRYIRVRYEDLLDHPVQTIEHILEFLELPQAVGIDLYKVVEERSIENRRAYIEKNGDGMIYGKAGQLKLLRKGVAGDWLNHFTADDLVRATVYFRETWMKLGYGFTPWGVEV